MTSLGLFLKDFARDDSGATAIEYGLIAVFVVLGLIAVVDSMGNALMSEYYNRIGDATQTAADSLP